MAAILGTILLRWRANRLRNHSCVAQYARIPSCAVSVAEYPAGCAQRPSSMAAASDVANLFTPYGEPLRDGSTPLTDVFRILLNQCGSVRM